MFKRSPQGESSRVESVSSGIRLKRPPPQIWCFDNYITLGLLTHSKPQFLFCKMGIIHQGHRAGVKSKMT